MTYIIANDFSGKHKICSISELESLLWKRHQHNANRILFTKGQDETSMLTLLLLNELAFLYFCPCEQHAGFVSLADSMHARKSLETTTFWTWPDEAEQVNNCSIVSSDQAYAATKEFFHTGRLPTCIEWQEL